MFQVDRRGSVVVVTFDRPPVNAINQEWLRSLGEIVGELETDKESNVLHLRSAHKAFCAGADLQRIAGHFSRQDGGDLMVQDVRVFQDVFQRIESLPQIVFAEIGGAALGGGLEVALACDLRMVALEAKLGLPEVGLGLIPGAGGTQRLTQLCGKGVASRVILAADVIDGATAYEFGIAQWAVPRADLEVEARKVVDRMAQLSPAAIRVAKTLIAAQPDPKRDGFSEELEADRMLLGIADTRERVESFLAGQRR